MPDLDAGLEQLGAQQQTGGGAAGAGGGDNVAHADTRRQRLDGELPDTVHIAHGA